MWNPEKIPHQNVTNLSISPLATVLEKLKKVILSNDSSWAFAAANTEQVLRSLNCVYFFHCWEDVYCVSPKNSQHDQVLYVPVAIKQRDISASRLLRTRPNFSKSVSPISKFRYTNLIFIESDAKINSQYCRDMLLMHELQPVICSMATDRFVLTMHQHAHRTHDVVYSFCAMRHPIH